MKDNISSERLRNGATQTTTESNQTASSALPSLTCSASSLIDLDADGKVINSGFPHLDGLTVDEGLDSIQRRLDVIKADIIAKAQL